MENKTVTSPHYNSINPVLKAAISSLDLDLESELNRYRRLKNKVSSHNNYNPSPPKVMPLEAFGLTAVGSLVHQPDEYLSQQKKEELSGPEDYFESSARLLNTLNQYDALQAENLLLLTPVKSPWGISSIFLLILGGFLLSLAFLPAEILANVPIINNLLVSEPENIPNSQVSNSQNKLDNSNINQEDFLGININNLSTLNINKYSPSKVNKNQSEAPVLSQEKTEQTPSLPAKNPNENLASALLPSLPTQSQASPNSSFQPSLSSSQLNKSYYYVFTDFQDPNSLISARNLIPDAYLVQFPHTKKIQLGAFVNQNDAQLLVQRLKNQGISASVFRP